METKGYSCDIHTKKMETLMCDIHTNIKKTNRIYVIRAMYEIKGYKEVYS